MQSATSEVFLLSACSNKVAHTGLPLHGAVGELLAEGRLDLGALVRVQALAQVIDIAGAFTGAGRGESAGQHGRCHLHLAALPLHADLGHQPCIFEGASQACLVPVDHGIAGLAVDGFFCLDYMTRQRFA